MYIGNTPAENYASFLTETFSVSATVNYTLSHAVTNENDIRLVINGVVQQPGSGKAYTASGTTLTLTSATVSGDVMYAVYLGRALQTVNPPNASVGLSQLSATGTKNSTTFLRGDNTFASAGGTNTPAFEAYLSSDQNVSSGVVTKIQFNTEDLDTNNNYDNSTNYRFTPTVAGKYYVYGSVRCGSSGSNLVELANVFIFRNGSEYKESGFDIRESSGGAVNNMSPAVSGIVDMNGSSDYVELFGRNLNSTLFKGASDRRSYFGAYRIIT